MNDVTRVARAIITISYLIMIPCSVGVIAHSVTWGFLTMGLLFFSTLAINGIIAALGSQK